MFYFKTLYSAEYINFIILDGERSAGQGGVCPVIGAQWPVASDRGPGCGARMARPGAECRPQSVTNTRPEQSCGVRTRGLRNTGTWQSVIWSNIDGKSDWTSLTRISVKLRWLLTVFGFWDVSCEQWVWIPWSVMYSSLTSAETTLDHSWLILTLPESIW